MPVIVEEGRFRFIIYTRENAFEPPHVHVWVGNEDICRVELNSGHYMDEPAPGQSRNILDAYHKHAQLIRQEWDRIHGR